MTSHDKGAPSIDKLGEFGLIDYITRDIKIHNKSTIVGIGDDAAVIESGDNYLVITTDLLMEGIHFNLIYCPLKHLGYKAVVVNLSDVYAMNATPKQITVSIAVSGKFDTRAIDQLYEGIKLACNHYKVDLVGGDTTSSLTGLAISVTAIGEVDKDKLTLRKGAKANDLICVSGDLGAAYMGLQLLERERDVLSDSRNVQPDFSGYEYILERQLKPEARKDIVELFYTLNVKPTSMIDISDGISSDIMHVCKMSDTGCRIYMDKIPIDTETITMAKEFNLAAEVCALNGGEDYELLFTIDPSDYGKIKDSASVSIIGYITPADEGCCLVLSDGSLSELKARGWNSFEEDSVKN